MVPPTPNLTPYRSHRSLSRRIAEAVLQAKPNANWRYLKENVGDADSLHHPDLQRRLLCVAEQPCCF